MLSMTTGQIGDPIAYFILMISNNRLLHVVIIPVLDDGVASSPTIIDGVSSVIFIGPSRRQRFSNGSSGR